MCGIVGALGNISETELIEMTKSQSHRGPDNLGHISLGNIHLGHSRLSIIDIAESNNQPLWDSSMRLCIVFNGEIYNYQELQKNLITKGYKFNTCGDTEVILNLYLDQGVEGFKNLNGIYAFAIWDSHKEELIVSRDGCGIKPLYFFHSDQGFYFASEMKALFKLKNVKKNLNYDSLYRTLIFLWNPGNETLIEGIEKFPEGKTITIKDNKIFSSVTTWTWPKYKPSNESLASHKKELKSAIEKSVKEQLVSDVPLGAFLSGGLDSSLIVSIASKHNNALKCFSIEGNEHELKAEGFENDLPYAKKVADLNEVDLFITKMDPDMLTLLPKIIYHNDELAADPAMINAYLICKQARESGIKVLLSGAGADDIFSGYRRHLAIKNYIIIESIPLIIKKMILSLTSLFNLNKSPKIRKLKKLFKYSLNSENQQNKILSFFYWLDPKAALKLFKDKNIISQDPLKFIIEDMNTSSLRDPLEKMLYLEKKYFLKDLNLNYTDKMSMANGVEVRVPFLDKNIIKIASNIPSRFKQRFLTGKWILKKITEFYLPKNIIYRKKTGFGAPLRQWLNNDLLPLIDEVLTKEKIEARGIFNSEEVSKMISDDRAGNADYSYAIYTLLCFELWCLEFLD